jgi:hypothetical protein
MKRILYLTALAAFVGSGCIKKKDLDFKNLSVDNWQPDWALPIINSKLTLKNIVQPNTTVTEDAQGMYSLHYSGDIFRAKASDYIRIPNQNYNTPTITLTIPQSVASFSGTVNDAFANHFTFSDTSGAQLANIHVKSGTIALNLTSSFKHNVTAEITFKDVKKGSTPLKVITSINYPSTTSSANIDLSGYHFNMTNPDAGGTAKNYIPYEVRFTVTGTGESLLPGDNLSANVSMTNIQYTFVDGFLGQYDISIPTDTIDVDVFDNALTANIYLRNPKIHLSFHNSFGLGVATKFDNIYGLTNKGSKVNMTIPDVDVPGATIVGQTVTKQHTIDSTNSSVQNMFNPAPNHVVYDGRVRINSGGTSTTYSFVTDTSTFTLTADAELPAWFSIIDFSLQDTVKLILPEDTSLLQKAEFKLLMDNAFPLYGRVQLYFADENYNFVDSLVPTAGDIIGEAPVDAFGSVNGRKQAVTTFAMTHDHYNAMVPKVRHALIRGRLKTSGTGDIKIQSSNNLIVKLAFRFTLNVSSTDL